MQKGPLSIAWLLLAASVAGAQDGSRELKAWLATLEPPKAERGEGVITGAVKGPEGKGLAGVEVVAYPQWSFPEAYPSSLALEAILRWEARHHRWRAANGGRAVTGDDGTFRIAGLVRRPFSVVARKPGFLIEGNQAATPDATMEFLAAPAARVVFEVRAPDGTLAEQVSIAIRGPQNSGRTWTPRMPWSDLRPGRYQFVAVSGMHRTRRSKPVSVELAAGAEPRHVVLQLREGPGIRGSIRFPTGFRPVSVYVVARPFVGGQPPPTDQLFAGRARPLLVDYRGWRYRIDKLKPGRYLVGLSIDGKRAYATEVVDVGDGVTLRDLALPPVEEKGALRIRVLNPHGGPVQRAFFRCAVRADRPFGLQALGIQDGVFLVRPPGLKVLAKATEAMTITAHVAQFGMAQTEWRPGQRELTIKFHVPSTVEVVVQGHESKLLRAQVRRQGRVDLRFRELHDGSAVFGPFQPAPLEVVLGVDQGGIVWPVVTRLIEPKPRTNRIVIEVPKLHELRVLGTKYERLTLERLGDFPRPCRRSIDLDGHGQAHVRGLPAGSYVVTGRIRGDRWRVPFTLPGKIELRTPGVR